MKNIFGFLVLLIFCLTSSAFAKDVSISSVIVNENKQGYSIILDTNKQVKYKKVNEGLNTTYFEINNVEAKDNIPVKYENTKTVESVTIQKVSSNKIKVYVTGDMASSTRLYITDAAGNPFYIEANKFDSFNAKDIALLIAGILAFSMLMSSGKKDEIQVTRTVYDNNAVMNTINQNKIIRINDFLNKENMSNPIRSEVNSKDIDLGMARKSA